MNRILHIKSIQEQKLGIIMLSDLPDIDCGGSLALSADSVGFSITCKIKGHGI